MTAPHRTARRVREREARTQAIRAAATRLFAERGYAQTTMEGVAARAELGKATLYYYYPTKQALFAEIVSEVAGQMRLAAETHLTPSRDPLEATEALYRFSLAFFSSAGDLTALLLPLMAGGPERLEAELGPEVAEAVAAAHAPLYQTLQAVCGRLAGGEAMVALMASLLIGLATKARHQPPGALQPEIDLFFHLVRRACAPE